MNYFYTLSQKNNSFLTVDIVSGIFNDVYHDFILAYNKTSPYTDVDSCLSGTRWIITLDKNIPNSTKLVVTHLEGTTNRLKMALLILSLQWYIMSLPGQHLAFGCKILHIIYNFHIEKCSALSKEAEYLRVCVLSKYHLL